MASYGMEVNHFKIALLGLIRLDSVRLGLKGTIFFRVGEIPSSPKFTFAERLDLVRPRRTIMCLPELSVKKTDKLRPFLNFQLQVTSSYFKFLVIARRHPNRNDPKLSWKSKNLRRAACAPDRPEQDRRRFCHRSLRR
jgi:hypothetical protein